jgi:16S rRNA processing protein RimM
MLLAVGRVGRPHGVRGEVTVEVRTDEPDLRFTAGSVLVTEPASRGPLTVADARWHSGRLLVRFAGYSDRTAAEGLRDTILCVESAGLEPPDDPDEFHDHDLIGLRVETLAGEVVGTVDDVLHHGQDLLVVRRAAGETMIPFVRPIVPEVDLPGGRMIINPPPGLLDPEEGESP